MRNLGGGIAKGDFAQIASNSALITFYAASMGNGGVTKLSINSGTNALGSIATASTLNHYAS